MTPVHPGTLLWTSVVNRVDAAGVVLLLSPLRCVLILPDCSVPAKVVPSPLMAVPGAPVGMKRLH